MNNELAPFLMRGDAAKRLLVLAAPESLTDALAQDLLRVALGETESERFVNALHLCDFVVERNSEWHFAPRAREPLVEQLLKQRDLSRRTHGRLLELAKPENEPVNRPDELPRYLETGVGRAYHGTFLSSEGIGEYAQLADQPLDGQQWLGGHLALEQVRLGVIPEDAVEVLYLRGMILYRERQRREAEQILRAVAQRSETRHEVAVASHLVGRIDGKRPSRRKGGEALLRKSLEILKALGDRFGVAQVLHTLGQLVGRDPRRRGEAEELLRESLAIGRDRRRPNHEAQVLHTLGHLVGRDPRRREEAEELLRESLEVNRQMRNTGGERIVQKALRNLRKKQ